jgi:alpha-glucosidase
VDVANMTGRLGTDDYAHEVAALVRAAALATRPDALVVAEHAHDATADLDVGGWHGTMNYAGFMRPLWTWLRSPEPSLPHFMGLPVPIPRWSGRLAVRTMREFASRNSWRTQTHSWNLLDSHDTARFRTVSGDPALVELGAGLLATMPGTPMLFAGDELGLPGVNGEDSRRPMPWHRPSTWDTLTLARYRQLIGLRRQHEALRTGGLRWAHVDDDSLAYWRESGTQRLLVFARRAAGPPVAAPGVAGTNLYGGAPLAGELPGDGPTFQVWAVD